MNKLTRKCVAAIASLAMAGTLCVAGAVTMASVAWGTPRPPVIQTPAAKAPWEQGAPGMGTLKIVKCDAATVSGSNGASECPADHKPIKDVEFTVTKIDKIKVDNSDVTLNLKEYSSWQAISKIVTKLNTGDIAAGDLTLATTSETLKTDENGKAEKTGLAIGLYKVEETKTPEGYGANDVQVFYMTLPLIEYKTEGNTTKAIYNYNPVVKPKNKDISKNITKTLDKSKTFAVVGDTIAYTISAEVNKSKPANGNLTKDDIQGFAVFDDAPNAAFASVTSDAVKKVKVDGEELTNAGNTTYYSVSTIAASNATDGKNLAANHTRILVKFEEAGLDKIAEKINGCTNTGDTIKVEVDLEFTISNDYKNTTAPEGDATSADTTKEEIVNKSGFFTGHKKGETPTPPIIPDGGKSTVDFGYLQVDKYNSEDDTKKLENAEFKLFTDKDKADACSKGLMENKELANIDACKAASASFDGKTNAEGKFQTPFKTIAGVPVYLVESKAPEGYARTPEVHTVTITKNKTKVEKFANFPVKGGDDGNKFWFNLPATGAAGVILFAVAGIGLIFTSVFLYVRNRKEEQRA
ncbi:LPXTG-motif cell wall anchor domain protein [Gardnerella vaginalis HMP9231]|uniref:SpaH/EbpB family LPXTG-anchored major pilin n=1 Tax=Gardnerella vaginalis TaxID=2702 RepID=UPI00020CDBE2|nr:SpaH/EbpB family LPXTG-anchored major pilin [Gardnerella vaginalis]AEF31739.1 LPXTG-motif cell wall anchor domain protein [Gardnerella vaginalis HMP9231]